VDRIHSLDLQTTVQGPSGDPQNVTVGNPPAEAVADPVVVLAGLDEVALAKS
jgi:hypothetical protein